MTRYLFILLCGLSSLRTLAQDTNSALVQSEIEFKSAFDHFSLNKVGSTYLFKNEPVELARFKEFLPVLSQSLSGSCDQIRGHKPDLTVKLHPVVSPGQSSESSSSENPSEASTQKPIEPEPITRYFYIKEKIVGDGNSCAAVTGEGIYYLPLHSSWFDKNKAASIQLGTTLSLEKKNKSFAKIKKQEDTWVDATEGQFLNWEFIDAFVQSLEGFTVDQRLHPAIANRKPSITLVTAKDKYVFYRIGTNQWAVQTPRATWLIYSKAWSFWQNMDEITWADPFTPQLRIVFDKSKELKERESTLKSLDNIWNPSIKRSFHKLVLDPEQDQVLRDIALQILKKKPTLENLNVFIKSLKQTDKPAFQSDLTKALRIRNPKGPNIQPDDDPETRAEAIKKWTEWWQKIEQIR